MQCTGTSLLANAVIEVEECLWNGVLQMLMPSEGDPSLRQARDDNSIQTVGHG